MTSDGERVNIACTQDVARCVVRLTRRQFSMLDEEEERKHRDMRVWNAAFEILHRTGGSVLVGKQPETNQEGSTDDDDDDDLDTFGLKQHLPGAVVLGVYEKRRQAQYAMDQYAVLTAEKGMYLLNTLAQTDRDVCFLIVESPHLCITAKRSRTTVPWPFTFEPVPGIARALRIARTAGTMTGLAAPGDNVVLPRQVSRILSNKELDSAPYLNQTYLLGRTKVVFYCRRLTESRREGTGAGAGGVDKCIADANGESADANHDSSQKQTNQRIEKEGDDRERAGASGTEATGGMTPKNLCLPKAVVLSPVSVGGFQTHCLSEEHTLFRHIQDFDFEKERKEGADIMAKLWGLTLLKQERQAPIISSLRKMGPDHKITDVDIVGATLIGVINPEGTGYPADSSLCKGLVLVDKSPHRVQTTLQSLSVYSTRLNIQIRRDLLQFDIQRPPTYEWTSWGFGVDPQSGKFTLVPSEFSSFLQAGDKLLQVEFQPDQESSTMSITSNPLEMKMLLDGRTPGGSTLRLITCRHCDNRSWKSFEGSGVSGVGVRQCQPSPRTQAQAEVVVTAPAPPNSVPIKLTMTRKKGLTWPLGLSDDGTRVEKVRRWDGVSFDSSKIQRFVEGGNTAPVEQILLGSTVTGVKHLEHEDPVYVRPDETPLMALMRRGFGLRLLLRAIK